MCADYLIVIVAVDRNDSRTNRNLAKIFISSLQRTGFSGDIFLISNHREPCFRLSRSGLIEHFVDLDIASDLSSRELSVHFGLSAF